MKSFELDRAHDRSAAIAAGAASATAQQGASVRFLAGGTTLVDLMKLGVERPDRLVDHQPAGTCRYPQAGRRPPVGRRHRQEQRSGSSPSRPTGLCRPVAGHPGRRIDPAAQCRHHRRQPAPAHALRLLSRHREPLQQARPRHRMPCHRRRQPHAGDPRHQRALHRHQSLGHGRGDDGLRRGGARSRRRRRAAVSPLEDFYRSPAGQAGPGECAAAGRPRDPCHPAAVAGRRTLRLSQAARPRILRVRAGLGGGRP